MRRGILRSLLGVQCIILAVVACLSLASAPAAAAQTAVGGRLTQNTTWQGDILVSSDVIVQPGVTLTMLPGTHVRFQHYRGYREPERRLRMRIEGSIVALGTASQPIYFTSDATDPQNGDWSMVRLASPTGPTRFHYCVFEFGQQGLNAWQASPEILHCVFRWNNWEGVYFESYCQPTLSLCQIYENGYNGLAAEQSNNIVMDNCEVWRNGTNGIHIDNSTAEVRECRIHDNSAHGLSVDNGGTLRAFGDTLYNNRSCAVGVGEGSNTVQVSNLSMSSNGGGVCGPHTVTVTTYSPPRSVDIGFRPEDSYALGYIPGDGQSDRYMYVYPDDETRRVVRKMGAGLGLTWSLAWDGRYIWTCTLSGHIYSLYPRTGQVLDHVVPAGSPTWGTPSQPWGMTFDDEGYLWLLDFAERKVFKIDPANGTIVYSFDTPYATQGGCKGLAWDGTYLNVLGWVSPVIYQMSKTGSLVKTIQLDHGGGGGLAWDGEHFWLPEGGGRILKYDGDGHRVGWIYSASEGTWDLAWDGTYLWASQRTNENWRDDKIFQLEVLQDHDPPRQSFPDVGASHSHYEAISGMADRGVIGGYANGNFGPEDLVMRQQFAKMIVLTLGLAVAEDDFPNSAVPFTDLGADNTEGLYPHEYVAVCTLNNITRGVDATHFDPYATITRAQVMTMVVRAADNLKEGTLRPVPAGWAGVLPAGDPTHGANIAKAEYNGLLAGIRGPGGTLAGWHTFGNATRAEVAQLLWNLLALEEGQSSL